MPELPEVETIVRGLKEPLEGKIFLSVEVLRADLLREEPADFVQELTGCRVQVVARRGKNIVMNLDRDAVLVVNLGMTGRLLVPGADSAHPGVRFSLSSGSELVYDDVRRFGVLERLSRKEWAERSRTLGPDPLEPGFTARHLEDALAGSRAPVRSWLLDQRKVAGVGNIYANEALHRAGVHPARLAGSIDREEALALHGSLRTVLRSAIHRKGTTLRDYRDSSGEPGSFSAELRVYGRVGLPCRRCGAGIERVVFGNRSAFFCPSCQPSPTAFA
ncbi:MAG: bifunctional DNA-formamidopyrimidine glycosylase/DNA-(apurinic or apyrimidinic site) lyase [Gemmatimonadota bacterium]